MQNEQNESDKIQQILLKSQSLLDNQQYYEYEQKILTFGFRFINQSKKDLAIQLYFQASKILLKLNQNNSGFNLANKIIEITDELDSKLIAEFLSLYSVAEFGRSKIELINRFLKKFPQSRENICVAVGVDLINQHKYHLAWRYLIATKETATEISLLEKWNLTLSAQEKEYNILRYILIKLSIGMLPECKVILEKFMPTKITLPSLFLHLLISAIQISSKQAFDQLYIQFKLILQQEPTLGDLYYKVGVQYFGLKEQQQGAAGLGGMLSQFFQ